MTGGAAIVEVLRAAGIVDVFGIASGKMMPLIKAISEQPEIRYRGVRHEAAAAFMAAGIAAGAGRPAVCLGETAPGGLNLLGGMGVGFANNLPVLAITSSHPARIASPPRGAFSAGNNERLFEPMVKWNTTIRDPGRIPEVMKWALREALTGRPGPVHLDVPADVLAASASYDPRELAQPLEAFVPPARQMADEAAVTVAVDLLRNAHRPLLIAGGGVVRSGAAERFRQMTAALGAPAVTTQMGLGVISSASSGFIGQGGTIGGEAVVRALRDADVILAVGCRFSSWMWTDGPPNFHAGRTQRLIHLDIDPTVMGRSLPVTVPLVGDADAVLGQLLAHFPRRQAPPSRWAVELRETYASYRGRLVASADQPQTSDQMHPAAFAREVGAFIGETGLAAFDGGHTTFWSNEFTPTTAPRTRFHDPGMAHLGYGLPFALALQHAFPAERVYNVTGDGAFGFTVQELDTARREGLNIINVVHNNAAWGVIGFAQRKQFDFCFGAGLGGTDYSAIARAFGCFGERVSRLEDVRPALQRSLDSGRPAVIEGMVSFEPHPMMSVFGRSTAG